MTVQMVEQAEKAPQLQIYWVGDYLKFIKQCVTITPE